MRIHLLLGAAALSTIAAACGSNTELFNGTGAAGSGGSGGTSSTTGAGGGNATSATATNGVGVGAGGSGDAVTSTGAVTTTTTGVGGDGGAGGGLVTSTTVGTATSGTGGSGGFVPGADGSPCSTGADCDSGTCLNETEFGLPGGACATLCDPEGACPSGELCVGDAAPGVCFPTCRSSNDCRDGYYCAEFGPEDVCSPDCESDAVCTETGECNIYSGKCGPLAGLALDGEACATGDDCESGLCLEQTTTGFPGGTCFSFCNPNAAFCPGGETCLDNTAPGNQSTGLCFAQCEQSTDCRAGYSCFDQIAAAPMCFPDCDADAQCAPEACNAFAGVCGPAQGLGIDGDPCMGPDDCESGQCLTTDFPGGYCISLCSVSKNNCPADTSDGIASPCLDVGGTMADLGICFDGCALDTDCRPMDYACTDPGFGAMVCVPN